jgi:hypothetical protein
MAEELDAVQKVRMTGSLDSWLNGDEKKVSISLSTRKSSY